MLSTKKVLEGWGKKISSCLPLGTGSSPSKKKEKKMPISLGKKKDVSGSNSPPLSVTWGEKKKTVKQKDALKGTSVKNPAGLTHPGKNAEKTQKEAKNW